MTAIVAVIIIFAIFKSFFILYERFTNKPRRDS
jgi:hypothetical protein